jgi:hypothetical protein
MLKLTILTTAQCPLSGNFKLAAAPLSQLVFPRESHFVIPGKAGMQIIFPGNFPGIDFYLIKLDKGHFLTNKMQYVFVSAVYK